MAAAGWLVEGLSTSQYRSLRKSNPARYQKIRTRTLQSARLRIPGVRTDMKAATSRGEQVVRDKGGVPNFHTYAVKVDGNTVYVKPDGFVKARYDTSGRATRATGTQEVKLVKYQAYTQQIRGEMALAIKLRGNYELHLPSYTVLSAPLKAAEMRGRLTIIRF